MSDEMNMEGLVPGVIVEVDLPGLPGMQHGRCFKVLVTRLGKAGFEGIRLDKSSTPDERYRIDRRFMPGWYAHSEAIRIVGPASSSVLEAVGLSSDTLSPSPPEPVPSETRPSGQRQQLKLKLDLE